MFRRYTTYIILILVLFVLPVSFIEPVRDATVTTIKPVARFFTTRSTALKSFILNLRELGSIKDERSRLQGEVLSLQQQLIDQEKIKSENETLRKEVGVTGATTEYPKVFARVILRGPDPLDRTFIIDVGSAQGISLNQPAIVKGVLIGKVITVREHSSVVRAITSQKSYVQARISTNQEQGLIVGTGNGLSLQDITQGIQVDQGSVVETSGLGGSLPQGILIGGIDVQTSSPNETSKTFSVRQEVNISDVDSMFILQISGL